MSFLLHYAIRTEDLAMTYKRRPAEVLAESIALLDRSR
jgi:hypothetical protein